jgi:hypothetical protein
MSLGYRPLFPLYRARGFPTSLLVRLNPLPQGERGGDSGEFRQHTACPRNGHRSCSRPPLRGTQACKPVLFRGQATSRPHSQLHLPAKLRAPLFGLQTKAAARTCRSRNATSPRLRARPTDKTFSVPAVARSVCFTVLWIPACCAGTTGHLRESTSTTRMRKHVANLFA